jgi:hypothetical protein
MNQMKELLKGAYDLHVHSAPDIIPRLMDDTEMAQRIIDAGMAGYTSKSHYFCTAERAQIINKLNPGCHAIGSITLNNAVGGINPIAVEMAGRAGTKQVWFPTCDCAVEQEHTFGGGHGNKLPYWAQVAIQMKEEGIDSPGISILDDQGKLTKETHDVLDVIAKFGMILCTSHISHEEAFALVKSAKEDHKIEHIIITHVDFPTTFYTVEEQKEFAKYGAYMEHCYTTYATKKVPLETTLEQIRVLGADRVILSTDLGQKTGIYPDEGMLNFVTALWEAGFSEGDIRKMICTNPKILLGED